MFGIWRIIHQAQNPGAGGLRQILDNPSSAVDGVVKWGRSGLDKSKATQAVTGIIDTVADEWPVGGPLVTGTVEGTIVMVRTLRHQQRCAELFEAVESTPAPVEDPAEVV